MPTYPHSLISEAMHKALYNGAQCEAINRHQSRCHNKAKLIHGQICTYFKPGEPREIRHLICNAHSFRGAGFPLRRGFWPGTAWKVL